MAMKKNVRISAHRVFIHLSNIRNVCCAMDGRMYRAFLRFFPIDMTPAYVSNSIK